MVTVSKGHRLDRCNKNEMYACSGSCMGPYGQAAHSGERREQRISIIR